MTATPQAEDAGQGTRLLRRCAAAGVALLYAVIVTSAYVRLAQAGLGCADWPACYGAQIAVPAAGGEPSLLFTVIARRLAAAAAGFVVIAIVVAHFGTKHRQAGGTPVVGALAALTIFLALLGRVTTAAPLPVVTLGNLLGGMLMLGLLAWLRLSLVAPLGQHRAKWSRCAEFGLVLLAAQLALGAMVSAHHAAATCATFPECHGQWWPSGGDLLLLDPWRVPALHSGAALAADPARAALHMLHRFGALIVVIYWAGFAAFAWRSRTPNAAAAALTALVLLMQGIVGAAAVVLQLPLALAVAHNALAALAVLAAVGAYSYSRSADAASVSAACQMVTSK
ncbi:MAG: hypothetical protein A3G24_28795 [Betaproteobacteria bacterium RIFCSPLOWO2_12_FULL_62_13]|nr:MAG: hypothetical protein A3G24_28795 [Betaproteobacteria bacterium RIFCSPLOWO2_12_FULL_62_13]